MGSDFMLHQHVKLKRWPYSMWRMMRTGKNKPGPAGEGARDRMESPLPLSLSTASVRTCCS